MSKIKAGIIGMGYISVSHIDCIHRVGNVELVAVSDVNLQLAKTKAQIYGIPKYYATVEELVEDPEIQVVHNCTPNNLHKEVNEKVLKAGKHLFSEKPLAKDSAESQSLVQLLNKCPSLVAGINFNYRMNPLVQEIKARIQTGEIGTPKLIHGSYLQDWLLFETDYNWRVDPQVSGASRCIADIGSHWMDLVQVVTGTRITEVCADLVTTIPVRKKPIGQVEAFAVNQNKDFEPVKVTTEDYGAVLFKMENGAHGVFYVSEVSAGRKCFLNVEIDGSKSSIYWNQENADQMWSGHRDKPNCLEMRNPNLMIESTKKFTSLAAGHPEGWNDAMTNNIRAFYRFIFDKKRLGKDQCDFATFEDGHYIMKLIEAILLSNKTKRWVKVE